MVLLLASASWTLVLSLIVGLCITARDGDLQHNRPPSPAVLELIDPSSVVATALLKQERQITPGYAHADTVARSPWLAETPGR